MKNDQSTYTSRLRIQNSCAASRKLWIEPWGDEILMEPHSTLEVVAKGPTGECLEVVNDESDLTVYGWPHSTLTVFRSGTIVREYEIPAPSIPQRADSHD